MNVFIVNVTQQIGTPWPIITTNLFKTFQDATNYIDALEEGYINSGNFTAAVNNVSANRMFVNKQQNGCDIHVFITVSEL